jgi:FAD-dependent urate hydroxylase
VPEYDSRRVSKLAAASGGFRLVLGDDNTVQANYVIIAAGIGPFAHLPRRFNSLPSEKVSHSSEHTNFDRFAGKRVIVIGGGQSAFESAALLLESGADVEILIRASRVIWLSTISAGRHLSSSLSSMFDPGTDVGPFGLNQFVARPRLFASLP